MSILKEKSFWVLPHTKKVQDFFCRSPRPTKEITKIFFVGLEDLQKELFGGSERRRPAKKLFVDLGRQRPAKKKSRTFFWVLSCRKISQKLKKICS